MRLVVTRPEPDASALKAQLIAMGHEVLVEPLLRIAFQPLDPQEIDLDEAQALIATSRNGVRALAKSPLLGAAIGLPIYAVGPGTAETARALGFENVHRGPRDAGALVGFVAEHAQVNAGSLIYLAPERKAIDLGGELRRLGFHVQEPVVYSVAAADRFSEPLVARFEAQGVDGVVLMSAQTARTYARLVLGHRLSGKLAGTVHFCLSPAVASGLAILGEPRLAIASQPDLKALLSLVARGVSDLQ
jgi:uroporphyrinogen-III synthase